LKSKEEPSAESRLPYDGSDLQIIITQRKGKISLLNPPGDKMPPVLAALIARLGSRLEKLKKRYAK
jgi:hypothetical protein